MANGTIHDIPAEEAERLKEAVIKKIKEMDEAEIAIRCKAYSSLAEVITQIAYEFLAVLGYTISIPIAWAENIIEGMATGFVDGFARGMRDQRVSPRRWR